MKVMWPLWWCLEPDAQAALMQLQWDLYGYRLQIPALPGPGYLDLELESPEKIAKIMRRTPRHQKRVA